MLTMLITVAARSRMTTSCSAMYIRPHHLRLGRLGLPDPVREGHHLVPNILR